MTLAEVAAVVGGEVVHDAGAMVSGPAFVDSRIAERDGLFVAVVGERVDGHDYAETALAAGAAAVLSSRDTGQPGVVVADPVAALAELARHSLTRLPDVRVVALTGSQGKTSTKDVLAQVLAAAGPTVATFGSFNNELGLPLTVLRADPDTRYLVVEMGARHLGDLRASCSVAPPHVSLVLNVGKAHLGEFGSQEAIAQAKGEIVEALPADGIAVLNADDPLVAAMAARTTAHVSSFGSDPGADVRFEDVTLDDLGRPSFDLVAGDARRPVTLQLIGEHHAANATAVAAVALALDVLLDRVVESLSSATATSPARMQLGERADGVTVLNDAYNANPDSMRAALKALAAIGRGRPGSRTVAVLGEMLELGASSREEHDAVGRLVVRLDIHQLLVVGQGARPIHLGACLEGSWGGESVFVPDTESAVAWLHEHLRPADVVLFKASRDAQLRRVAETVLAESPTDPSVDSAGTSAPPEETGQ
ncbi:MAG TPA: UDP-N-acetylmuramoyl-tripeptide--D-alanyl-D-alanine ligase [Nocardioidaceae bacterium]|nr:UDP-N-acetylmuramoyl-tripeptide--D-alanyl-D-alanine ligase [Nocardioidaceae bacterium]